MYNKGKPTRGKMIYIVADERLQAVPCQSKALAQQTVKVQPVVCLGGEHHGGSGFDLSGLRNGTKLKI